MRPTRAGHAQRAFATTRAEGVAAGLAMVEAGGAADEAPLVYGALLAEAGRDGEARRQRTRALDEARNRHERAQIAAPHTPWPADPTVRDTARTTSHICTEGGHARSNDPRGASADPDSVTRAFTQRLIRGGPRSWSANRPPRARLLRSREARLGAVVGGGVSGARGRVRRGRATPHAGAARGGVGGLRAERQHLRGRAVGANESTLRAAFERVCIVGNRDLDVLACEEAIPPRCPVKTATYVSACTPSRRACGRCFRPDPPRGPLRAGRAAKPPRAPSWGAPPRSECAARWDLLFEGFRRPAAALPSDAAWRACGPVVRPGEPLPTRPTQRRCER